MANSVGKYLLQVPKTIADVVLSRLLGAMVKRLNELTAVFAGADGGTSTILSADGTWTPADYGERQISASAMHPAVVANWTRPSAATDYYTSGAAGTGMHIALPVRVGQTLTKLRVLFYRGSSSDPTIRLYAADYNDSSASIITPVVAWTAPSASTTWEVLEATYDTEVFRGNWYLYVLANNIGDRIRAASVTVGPE